MRILFPTDGSEATEEAFERLMSLLDGMHESATVTVFNVTDEGFELADHAYVQETYEADERDEVFPSRDASRRAVQRCVDIADKHDVDVHTKIVTGTYKEEILDEAGDHDVLAMHGLRESNLKGFLKGSKTEKLARNAPCSVLLLRVETPP